MGKALIAVTQPGYAGRRPVLGRRRRLCAGAVEPGPRRIGVSAAGSPLGQPFGVTSTPESCPGLSLPHRLRPMGGEVRRVPDDEVDGEEGWDRLIDDDVRGVEAIKVGDGEWSWQVILAVAEFVREDPLESELRERMVGTLRAAPGVTAVAEEDREVWIVNGQPSGEALVRAAARVVDDLAPRCRAFMEGLA